MGAPAAAPPPATALASWDRAVAEIHLDAGPAAREAGAAAPAAAAPASDDAGMAAPAMDATASALPSSTTPAPQAVELPADAAAMSGAAGSGPHPAEATRDIAQGAGQGAGQADARVGGQDGAGARFSGSVPSAADAATFAPATASAGAGDVGAGRVQPDVAQAAGDAGATEPSGAAQAGIGGLAGGPAAQGPLSSPAAPGAASVAGGVMASGGRDAEGALLLAPAVPQGAARASGQDRAGPGAGPPRREPGAGRGRAGPAGEAGGPAAAAGWGQGPIEDAYGTREQAGSLLAEGDAPSGQAAAFLGALLPGPGIVFTAASVMGNPLWAWAVGEVLGGQDGGSGVPAWERLGVSPAALAAMLRDTPWLVVGAQVGHPVGQADVMALQTLAGPLPDLLRLGVDPRIALTVQLGWEAALLGGPDPVTGDTLPPLWRSWGLEAPESLAALAELAGADGSVAVPAHPAERPSAVAALLLGLLPVAQAVPEPVRAAVRLSPVAALLGPAGLGGLGRVEDGARSGGIGLAGLGGAGLGGAGLGGAGLGGAGIGAVIAVRGRGGEPVLLTRQGEGGLRTPAGAEPLVLGKSAVPGASLTLATGLAGPSPCVLASWHPSRDVAALAALLAAALPMAPAAVLAAEWTVPLDGAAAWGWIVAEGGAVRAGPAAAGSDAVFAGPPPPARVRRMLHLGADRRAPGRGDFDAHVSHGEQRPVAIDLSPARPATQCWRLDDTRSLVAVGSAGPQAASVRAAELYRSLLHGGATLDLLQPGEGMATWEGSPLWLALAGIGKPASLGVALNEATPARVEVLRLPDGTWHVEHAGGAYAAPRRRLHGADAAESSALLTDVLYGVPEEVVGEPARRSFAGFAKARAHTIAVRALSPERRAPGGDPLRDVWRAREAWAAVARDWARIAAALDGVAAAPGSGKGVAQGERSLIDRTGRAGPPAGTRADWDAPDSLDAPATLSSILAAGAPADALATIVALRALAEADATRHLDRVGSDAARPERQKRDQALADAGSALWCHGEAVLSRVSGGAIGEVSRADGLALAVRLGRLQVAADGPSSTAEPRSAEQPHGSGASDTNGPLE